MDLTVEDIKQLLLDLYVAQRETQRARAELEQVRARVTELEAQLGEVA